MNFLKSLIILFVSVIIRAIHANDVDSVKEKDPALVTDKSNNSDPHDENELEDDIDEDDPDDEGDTDDEEDDADDEEDDADEEEDDDEVYEGEITKYNIKKSERDKRSYRGLVLRNGLQVVLISDPETDRAAASMSVNVGCMHDFEDLPGAAHFLEHMLFMGSKKYPVEDYYHKFIDEHAGTYNGGTAEYYQNYYWDVSSDVLEDTLDIMAQIFLNPLMKKSATKKELKAIDSELKVLSIDDLVRFDQLKKSLSKPGHRHRGFDVGNTKTLKTDPELKGIDVHARLWELYKSTYSSNVMHLAVLGKESIEDLEKIVAPRFEKIKNKHLEKPLHKEHPWGPEQVKRKVYYVPMSDIRRLSVRFPLPDDLKYYKHAPLDYLSHLLGHEASGSILAELKERNWADDLGAGNEITPGFEFFYVQIELTKDGLNHEDEIVELIFKYIYLLKNGGIQKEVFDEIKKVDEINFQFKSKEIPFYYVQEISAAMVDGYPLEDVLTCDIPEVWNPSIIEEFLNYLRPDNMIVLIASKSFKKHAKLKEEWYGTKHKIVPISSYLIDKMWNITQPFDKFHLPSANKYIPDKFDLYPLEANNTKFPRLIHESEISQFWFRQDDEYKIPKFKISFNMFCPVACLNIKNQKLRDVFITLFGETFSTRVGYTASLAGLQWSVKSIFCGIKVSLSGYTEKLPLYVEEFLFEMINLEVKSNKFDVAKDTMLLDIKNFYTNQPHSNASSYLWHILHNFGSTIDERYANVKILQADDMKRFMKQFFSRIFIQGLIYGNCSEKLARDVINSIENAFKLQQLVLTQEIVFPRVLKLDDGTNFTYEKPHKYSENSCYYGYFQIGPDYPTSNTVVAQLFTQLVNEKFFDTLRTNEQLGYIIDCEIRRDNGILAFVIYMQSEEHPAFVHSRVNMFLKNIEDILIEMTPQDFEINKTSLRNQFLEKILSQGAKFGRYWTEIMQRRYDFGRAETNKVKILDSLTKEDVINFFNEYIHESSTKRRKLDIYVTSEITNPEFPANEPTMKGTKIEDIVAFRSHLRYFSHTHPHMDIAPPGVQVITS